MFLKYSNWMFYLPLAPFIRPSIYMVHSHLNFVYQFWIHTQIIKSIGPLEHILVINFNIDSLIKWFFNNFLILRILQVIIEFTMVGTHTVLTRTTLEF